MSAIRPQYQTIQTNNANAALTAVATKAKPFHVRTAAKKVLAAINAGKNPQKVCRDAYRVVCRKLNKTFLLPIYGGAYNPESGGGVVQDPLITSNPQPVTTTNNTPVSFSVTATGLSALSYQWQFSTDNGNTWTSINGGNAGSTFSNYTTATLGVLAGLAINLFQFRCAVTDSNGTVNSQSARLQVI